MKWSWIHMHLKISMATTVRILWKNKPTIIVKYFKLAMLQVINLNLVFFPPILRPCLESSHPLNCSIPEILNSIISLIKCHLPFRSNIDPVADQLNNSHFMTLYAFAVLSLCPTVPNIPGLHPHHLLLTLNPKQSSFCPPFYWNSFNCCFFWLLDCQIQKTSFGPYFTRLSYYICMCRSFSPLALSFVSATPHRVTFYFDFMGPPLTTP